MPFGIGFFATAGAGGGGAAFELISTQVLTGSASSVTFSSIPATYKHLQIRAVTKVGDAGSSGVDVRLNSDSGTNYRTHYLIGTGSTVFSSDAGAGTSMGLATTAGNNTTSAFGAWVLDALDYANTAKNTTLRTLSGFTESGYQQIRLASGLWVNTSAVTSVTLLPVSSTFLTGCRFSLYGVRG